MDELEANWTSNKDNFAMDTDDDSDDDVADLIPQFDGASDKISGSNKKSGKNQVSATLSQNAGSFQTTDDLSKSQPAGSDLNTAGTSDMTWRTGAAGRGQGNSQNYPSGNWTQQGWPQQSGSGSGSWHGHNPSWSQQYENWPQQQQRMPSAFPSQQVSFRSTSPATSFQSSPNIPYASPTHQQTFQTPSPSQLPYHYPPYQSPPSNQPYQQPYQSPSQHPYQSPRSSQTFHSPQPYNSPSSHQPYQSPSASQAYQSLGATSQPYQATAPNKPYPSTTGIQPQSAGLPYQPTSSNHPFQQATGVQMYPSSYQSSLQTSLAQPYPQPYQSPAQDGCYSNQSALCPQGYSGYNQGSSHEAGPQSNNEKHVGEPSQPSTLYGQPANQSSDGQGSFFPSQCISRQEQTDIALSSTKPVVAYDMYGPEVQSNQFDVSQPHPKTGHKKRRKNAAGVVKFKPPKSPLSPTPSMVSKTPFEVKYSSSNTLSLTSETAYSDSHNIQSPQDYIDDLKSIVTSRNKALLASPVTKISTLEFKPNISSSTAVNNEPSLGKGIELLNNTTSLKVNVDKVEKTTSTPMIQQLLMEEPVRMNIKKEDREAVVKKPMASPIPPKPKRKYKKRVKQALKIPGPPGRPRTACLSAPVPPMVGYCGYSPQSMMNPSMIGHHGRPHSVSLPFNCETRMPSPIHNYDCQPWKQHSYPPSSQWQEQQQQQWRTNEWQNFENSVEPNCNTSDMSGMPTSKSQHRSFGFNTVQSPICHQNLQAIQSPSLSDHQNVHNISSHGLQTSGSSYTDSIRENVSEKSSLSSLFQLISDVGSDDTGWESASVSVIPSLFSSNTDSETLMSMPVSDLNQGSPSSKDFITLETPCKQDCEKTNSDAAGMTSSEESDRMDLDLSSDLKHRTMSRSFNFGNIHPRVGKQNRARKLGIFQTRGRKLCATVCPTDTNPSYTYTFHVPTTVFKKLKFFRCAESRKHNINVVRMHPMDARRYSLLKIGREIVKVIKLTEADLANYNVVLSPPSHFVSADGCTNRVNLDIPIVSVDKETDNNGSDKVIFSKFDTDFPPNKVAPPSSFHASQISASLVRTSSTSNHLSSHSTNWARQFTGHQSANYNGGISPGSQQTRSPQDGNFVHAQQQEGLQQTSQTNINREFSSQLAEDSSTVPFHQHGQKRNSYQFSAPSSIQDNYYTTQQGVQMNHLQQQQQNYQQQAESSDFNTEPKNGLRSPGQHGLANRIESGRAHNSGDQELKIDENTTKSSHFNTRVNALIHNNHAEYMASNTTTGVCATAQQSTNLNTYIEQADIIDQLNDERKNICKEHLSLKAITPCYCTPEIEESLSTVSKNSHEDLINDLDDCECTPESCDDAQKQTVELTGNNRQPSLILQDKSRGRLSLRKNVKALRLAIPQPRTNLNLVGSGGVSSSSRYIGRDSALSSQKDSDDDDNSKDVCASRRSTRSSKIDYVKSVSGSRHSPRQVKHRSTHSKSLYNLKPKKRRKRQEHLLEGVHYIVVGKFKGHQSMIVKVNKLNVEPTQRVNAHVFEELGARDIVRSISSVNSVKGIIYAKSEQSMYLRSSTEYQSDSDTNNRQFRHENSECDQQSLSTSRSCKQASRGRSVKHGKFRSAVAASLTQREVIKVKPERNSTTNETGSKNVMAGPGGASVNNVQSTYFVEDDFFFKFKESFIQQFKIKELNVGCPVEKNHENIFFEGVRQSSFLNFQQRFIANVQKLTNGGYSSSSDDEDDVLDNTILKEIDTSHKLVASQVISKLASNNVVKHEHSIAKDNLWTGQSAAGDTVCVLPIQCDRSEFKRSSAIMTVEKDQDDEWLHMKEQSSFTVKDTSSNLHDEGTSSCGPTFQNSQEGISKSQETKIEKIKQSLEVDNEDNKMLLKNTAVKESTFCQQDYFGNSIIASITNSNYTKDDDDKEDYLKCQMGFFEDISSDSDSNDTIITDNYIGKENMFHRYSTNLYPSLPYNVSSTDRFVTSVTTTKSILAQEINHVVTSDALKSCKQIEHHKISSFDQKCNNAELSQVFESHHKKPEICIDFGHGGGSSQTLKKGLENVPSRFAPELSQEHHTAAFTLTHQQKDASFFTAEGVSIMSGATEELDIDVPASTRNSGIVHFASKVVHLLENEIIETLIDHDHNAETITVVDTSREQKKQGKYVKKSKTKRDLGRKRLKRTHALYEGSSSSDDETSVSLDGRTSGQSLFLGGMKKPGLVYYTEDLNIADDVSSDEDYTAHTSQHKDCKNNRKLTMRASKDSLITNLSQVSVDTGRGTRGGHRARPTRGKRKKQSSGDKLLNSLSLLHMATLANLTEAQSDPPNDQFVSKTVCVKDEIDNFNYLDRLNNDSNSTTSLTQDKIFSTAPKNSPMPCLSASKKRWERRRINKEDTTLSIQLVDYSLSNLKPGCNGVSNAGSVHMSDRIVNNFVAPSPVSSKLTFNSSSESCHQPQTVNPTEELSMKNTLQLLETRRAQVNCASFSMKDILKLTTPDDSMDSDSLDSVAPARFHGTKRAQVKSTSLSMSDILKLTSIDQSSETDKSQASTLSLLSNSDFSKTTGPCHKNMKVLDTQFSHPNSQTHLEATVTCNLPSQKTDLINNRCQTQVKTIEASDSFVSQLTTDSNLPSLLHNETTEGSQLLLSHLENFQQKSISSLPENSEKATLFHVPLCSFEEKTPITTSDGEVQKKVKSTLLSVSNFVNMNTSVDIDNSERNMNSFNTIQCLGNMNEKINEDLSKSNISDVGKRIEHQKTNTPSKQSTELATSPVVCNNMDTDCSSEPVSSSSSQNMVKEKSFSERNLSQLHLSSLESMSKACKQQEEQEASDNIDMLDKTAIVTTLEAAGIESLSLRSVEGTKISNLESHPVLPSQVHFPSNIPETPVSPVWETPMVAVTTAETPRHEKLSCNNFKPQSSISKQENRGHHKNMSVKNGMRGMKPLHPLQIPPYSYTDHDVNSQSQQVFHNARSSSLYHPYFWQWPVHTPGSDPAVSPLNLCTTQKSPNNYSPITPTSPLSPNYPTQGATESSLSPQAKIGGKPLWYPWLKINSARSETKIGCHTSPADHSRHYRSKNELEHTYESFSREPAQMESRKVKHDTRINSKLQKHSPRRFQSQFSWSKPASLKINETISNSATISNFLGRVIKTAHKLGNRNLPSTSNSENLKDVSLKTVSETSGNVAFEAKQRFRFRKNGGQCRIANSAHWSGDTATIPDSLDICHSYKSSPSLSNDNNSRISEATEKRRKLCSEGSNITTKCGTEHERLRSKLKNMRKPKGKFKLSTPASQPTCSTDFEHSNDHEQFRLTDCVGNQLIKDGDKLEYCHKKTADISGSNPLQTSILKRSNKRLYDGLYSQDDSPQKCGRNVNDDQESISYRYGKEEKPICQSGDLTYPVKSPP